MMLKPDPWGRPLRVGVCGIGHWAKTVHLPALASMPEVDLVGVWGRAREQSEAVAREFAVPAFTDFDALLDEVDAVSFAVPPGIQAGMALRAAGAGKHLLLEKPMATSLADADRLVEVVMRQQLSAVTFLTRTFLDDADELIAAARAAEHNHGEASWSSRALLPGTPFTNSTWRNGDYGTLLDLGPHVLSILVPVFGRVLKIEADRVRKARFACRILHEGGAQSTVTLDQMDEALTQGSQERYVFSGGEGVTKGGPFKVEPVKCFTAALHLLIGGIGMAGGPHGANLRHSRNIVAVLEAARASIESGGISVEVRP